MSIKIVHSNSQVCLQKFNDTFTAANCKRVFVFPSKLINSDESWIWKVEITLAI